MKIKNLIEFFLQFISDFLLKESLQMIWSKFN